ncbi:MAG: DUF4129 domain-containing protein, partial [Caldilineaceae bacterium]
PWTGGTIFWILAALLLGYAAYIYFGGRGVSFAWLRQLWQMLRTRWDNVVDAYQDWQATRFREEDDSGTTGGRRRRRLLDWLGYRGLDPDAKIRYYYLSLLEQAEQAGRPRHRSETPYGYAPRLAQLVAEAAKPQAEGAASSPLPTDESQDAASGTGEGQVDEQDINKLTEAFVHVRYAGTRFDSAEASKLQASWERLKRSLRR